MLARIWSSDESSDLFGAFEAFESRGRNGDSTLQARPSTPNHCERTKRIGASAFDVAFQSGNRMSLSEAAGLCPGDNEHEMESRRVDIPGLSVLGQYSIRERAKTIPFDPIDVLGKEKPLDSDYKTPSPSTFLLM